MTKGGARPPLILRGGGKYTRKKRKGASGPEGDRAEEDEVQEFVRGRRYGMDEMKDAAPGEDAMDLVLKGLAKETPYGKGRRMPRRKMPRAELNR